MVVLRRGSEGHCPPPQFNGLPPQLYCPNFFCTSTIAHAQCGHWCCRLKTVGNYY